MFMVRNYNLQDKRNQWIILSCIRTSAEITFFFFKQIPTVLTQYFEDPKILILVAALLIKLLKIFLLSSIQIISHAIWLIFHSSSK